MEAPPFLQSPALNEAGVRHGFFGRAGGVSVGDYDSLNTGPGSADNPDRVRENRARCARALDAEPGSLITLHQIHSPIAVLADAPFERAPEADGSATRTPGLVLGALAADCMPFLFADPANGVTAAAHAGWRGALGGVLEATIDAMERLGAARSRIIAALGPCLRQPNFEVGLDLVQAFTEKYPQSEQYFAPGVTAEKRQLDLAGFGRWRLAAVGVENLDDLGVCTLASSAEYFSYRASRRAGAADYGRNLSAIVAPG